MAELDLENSNMPRFQSWLFNSIDRSLPVQLGRRARLACQQLISRIGPPRFASLPAAWEQVSKQVARVVLYPVYLIAIAAKRSYPQLSPDPKSAPTKPPLLLRPFQQLVVWVEDSEIFASDRLANQEFSAPEVTENIWNPTSLPANPSPQVPLQRHLGQGGSRLGSTQYQQRLERIRQLIKAAIAYFFGKKPNLPPLETVEVRSQPWLTMEDLFDDDSCHWPAISQHEPARREISPWEPDQFDGTNPIRTRSLKPVLNRALTKTKQTSIIPTATSDPLASALIHESKSTSEIVPDLSCWLDDSFDFEIEERSRPLKAWIETQATFIGYVYSPIMEFIRWIDRLVAKFEQWLVQLWQKTWDKLRGDD
jgi:hypothetical protein